MAQLSYNAFDTRLGDVVAVANNMGIVTIAMAGQRETGSVVNGLARSLGQALVPTETGVAMRAERELKAYLSGNRRKFDVPLAIDGSAFARRVWTAIAGVPFGETISYGQLAVSIGRPTATRAVANACGANPVPVIIPCHRVIASDGGLGGFSAGVSVKRQLLALERGSGDGLPLFRVADEQAVAQSHIIDGMEVLESLEDGLASWLVARMDGDLSKATAWMETESWADQVFDRLTPHALAALTELVVMRASKERDSDRPLVEPVAFELVASLASPAILSHSADSMVWETALRCSFVLDDAPHVERVLAQYLSYVRPAKAVFEAVSGVLESVLEGRLRSAPAMRERAVDLWMEVRAGRGELPIDAADFAARGLWQEAILQGEALLAQGAEPRRPILRQLAEAYEAIGDNASAIEHLQTLWLETGDTVFARELRRLRDGVTPT